MIAVAQGVYIGGYVTSLRPLYQGILGDIAGDDPTERVLCSVLALICACFWPLFLVGWIVSRWVSA